MRFVESLNSHQHKQAQNNPMTILLSEKIAKHISTVSSTVAHSAQAPNQTHHPTTISTSIKEREHHKQIEKEEELIGMCIR